MFAVYITHRKELFYVTQKTRKTQKKNNLAESADIAEIIIDHAPDGNICDFSAFCEKYL